MEAAIVATIVGLVLFFCIRTFYKKLTGKNNGCACSSGKSCSLSEIHKGGEEEEQGKKCGA